MDEREGKYINPYTDYGFERAIRTAEAKGREEGLAEGEAMGHAEDARKMKQKGYSVEDIVDITGLSAEVIAKL